MKKILLLIFSVTVLFGYSVSEINNKCDMNLKNKAYDVCYSYKYKSPLYSSYDLTREKVIAIAKREQTFYTDKRIPSNYRTTETKYKKMGLDKGHLAEASVFDWSEETQKEANYMSNIVPQYPLLNRQGAWRDTEELTMKITRLNGKSSIISGVYYDNKSYKINTVEIPDYLYKIIILDNSYVVFFIKNDNKSVMLESIVTLKHLYSIIPFRFNIPKEYRELPKEKIQEIQRLKN